MKALSCCLLLSFVSLYATCKRVDCKQTIYSFQAFVKAYPDKDSIRVGDSIYFELNAPTQLKDLTTGQVVDYSGAVNFGPSIKYGEFTGDGNASNPGIIAAANSFTNVLMWGTPVNSDRPEQVRTFLCLEENGEYKFKVAVVPNKKGTFIITIGNTSGVYRRNNECDKATFDLKFQATDQHIHFLEQNRTGYVITDSDREHLYCFKVY